MPKTGIVFSLSKRKQIVIDKLESLALKSGVDTTDGWLLAIK